MVHFCIALPCEAREIIQSYRLKPCGNHGKASLFEADKARLAVTGIGSLSSAIATTALGTRFPSATATWINIGICGHRDAPIGETFIANRIESDREPERIFPQLSLKANLPGVALKTVSEPTSDYPANLALDMEAYGFFKAAIPFATIERVHAIKIVSDNAANLPPRRFDKDWIASLVRDALPKVMNLIEGIESNTAVVQTSRWPREFAAKVRARFRLTETELQQLRTRLRKLDFLLSDSKQQDLDSNLEEADSKKALLESLQQIVDKQSSRALS